MKAIVFPNPRMKLREESFGGIAKTDKGVYLLDRNAYSTLLNTYIDRPENNPVTIDETVQELININALVQIDKEDVKWVRTKREKSRNM